MRFLQAFFGLAALAAGEKATTEPVEHRLPAPSSVYPQGARPGERVRVEILGQHLDRAARLLFLDDALAGRIVKVEPARIEAELESRPGAALGAHYFRVLSPRGASSAVLFRLGSQPHRNEREPNSAMDEAEAVTLPATINARLERDNDYDFFRFRAAAGETLVFDLRAARNGSSLDAALVLLDARGRKLEHDEDTFIWDPFFAHKFEEAGDYFAVVQPTHTRNDPGFVYQLDIRRDAHLETVSPISLRPGQETEVTIYGAGLADRGAAIEFDRPGLSGELISVSGTSAAARLRVAGDAAPGAYAFTLRGSQSGGGTHSNPVKILVDTAPPYAGSGEIAQFPVSINGTARYRQPERFPIRVQAGDTLVCEVRAQRFGSPVDSVVRILDGAGKTLASNDDGNFAGTVFNKDSRLMHKFAEGGLYTIEIRNLWMTTGEDFPYQLRIAPPKPRAELQLGTDHPYVFAGETAKLKVSAVRVDGLDGDIPLSLAGLPAGVTAKPAVIAAGANEAEIEIDAREARPGETGLVTISSPLAERKAWRAIQISSGGGEGRHYGQVEGAALTVAERPLFSLECAVTAITLVPGGAVPLKVAIRRRDGFEAPLAFAALNLPAGVTVQTLESKDGEATLEFRAAANVKAGREARVMVAASGGGQTHAAPKIAILVE